jgi:hypothetical protein
MYMGDVGELGGLKKLLKKVVKKSTKPLKVAAKFAPQKVQKQTQIRLANNVRKNVAPMVKRQALPMVKHQMMLPPSLPFSQRPSGDDIYEPVVMSPIRMDTAY